MFNSGFYNLGSKDLQRDQGRTRKISNNFYSFRITGKLSIMLEMNIRMLTQLWQELSKSISDVE